MDRCQCLGPDLIYLLTGQELPELTPRLHLQLISVGKQSMAFFGLKWQHTQPVICVCVTQYLTMRVRLS